MLNLASPGREMMKNIKEFIAMWVILIGTLAFLSYISSPANPIVRPRLERIEPFQNVGNSHTEQDMRVSPYNSLSPADADLISARDPYNLLKGVLPKYDGPVGGVSPTSRACYDADFQKRLERTGNFRQLTNNYKRGDPDSCSAPNHDLLLSFYKVEPLSAA